MLICKKKPQQQGYTGTEEIFMLWTKKSYKRNLCPSNKIDHAVCIMPTKPQLLSLEWDPYEYSLKHYAVMILSTLHCK